MEIDQVNRAHRLFSKATETLSLSFWGDLSVREVKVSRKILHVCRDRCQSYQNEAQMRDRPFQESWYSRRDWLCGSVKKNRLLRRAM